MLNIKIKTLLITITLCLIAFTRAYATQMLLDAEVQNWLNDMAAPLLKAAETPANTISFNILMNDEVNAFATPNRAIFFNSGLILKAENASEFRGVMAHEMGHILSQHHLGRYDDIHNMKLATLSGALLGLGAALAGSGEGVTAAVLGGQAFGQSNYLKHSRTDEREADQHAISLLKKSNFSVKGMVSFFRKLYNDQLLTYKTPPAHLITHPLPVERLSTLTDKAKTEPPSHSFNTENEEKFKLIQAKIYAFEHTPPQTLRKYRGNSTPDKIARIIAYLFQGKIKYAQKTLTPMLDKSPNNPYLNELGGHIALDSGDLPTAAKAFKTAIDNAKDDNITLIRFHYARTLEAQHKHTQAINQLQAIRHQMPRWPAIWYALGVNYGKIPKIAESHLSLAEYHLLLKDLPSTKQQLHLAKSHIKNTSHLQKWDKNIRNRIDLMEKK